jgi:hypothetical protein
MARTVIEIDQAAQIWGRVCIQNKATVRHAQNTVHVFAYNNPQTACAFQ